MKELTEKELIELYSGTITEEDYKRVIEPYGVPFRRYEVFQSAMQELLKELMKDKK